MIPCRPNSFESLKEPPQRHRKRLVVIVVADENRAGVSLKASTVVPCPGFVAAGVTADDLGTKGLQVAAVNASDETAAQKHQVERFRH
jgi:hypothetical protein